MFWWLWAHPPLIEEATDKDFDQLAQIHARSFSHEWDSSELASLSSQNGVKIFLARRSDPFGSRNPVGFVTLRTVADEAEILTIAVDPRQRGRGVARKLMETARYRLYAERVKDLFLEVDAANAAAVSLYKSLGFKEVGKRKGYYAESDGDGTALVMRYDLR